MAGALKKKLFDQKYEILSVIGRGATSVVYHARDTTNPDSKVALKVLINRKNAAFSTERLRTEALALASSRNKNVIELGDFRCTENISYLVLDLATFGDLRTFLSERRGPLSQKLGRSLFLQAAAALMSVHKAGLVHCDITPDNLLLFDNHHLCLADFGEAIFVEETFSLKKLLQGLSTNKYLAPEVLGRSVFDRRSDIYSLGLTFYELFSGVHPFDSIESEIFQEVQKVSVIPDIALMKKSIPADLAAIIMKCLEFDPEERFQNALELYEAIASTRLSDLKEDTNESVDATEVAEDLYRTSPNAVRDEAYQASKDKVFYLLDALDESVATFGSSPLQVQTSLQADTFKSELAIPKQKDIDPFQDGFVVSPKKAQSPKRVTPAQTQAVTSVHRYTGDEFVTPVAKNQYSLMNHHPSQQAGGYTNVKQWTQNGQILSGVSIANKRKGSSFKTGLKAMKKNRLSSSKHFGTFFKGFLSLGFLLIAVHVGHGLTTMVGESSFYKRITLMTSNIVRSADAVKNATTKD